MILQKLASAIRRQDWFQVLIEVLIVIVGIYLGFQVTQWGQEREARITERAYLEQIHSELENVQASFQAFEVSYCQYFTLLSEFSMAMTTENNNIKLGQPHCNAIARSHIYFTNSVALPTMIELLSSGQLSILQDKELRTAITTYLIDEEQGDQGFASLMSDKLEIQRNHPELIRLRYNQATTALPRNTNDPDMVSCDFEAMKESQACKNDLVSNTNRQYVFGLGQFNRKASIENILEVVKRLLDINA